MAFAKPHPFSVFKTWPGVAEGGADYTRRIGTAANEQVAREIISDDKASDQRTGNGSFGGLLPRQTGETVYRVFRAEWTEIQL